MTSAHKLSLKASDGVHQYPRRLAHPKHGEPDLERHNPQANKSVDNSECDAFVNGSEPHIAVFFRAVREISRFAAVNVHIVTQEECIKANRRRQAQGCDEAHMRGRGRLDYEPVQDATLDEEHVSADNKVKGR